MQILFANKRAIRWIAAVWFATLSLPLTAQDKPSDSSDSQGWGQESESGTSTETENTGTLDRQDDSDFIRQAYRASQAQVELGNLALQNAASDQVKQYAQQVVDDFTRAREELQAFAQPSTPQANETKRELTAYDNAHRSQYERKQYPYLKDNPYLLEEMENFNVSGSGLGTSGGTTGTAVSRPARPRNPTNSRPNYANAGMGASDVTQTGTGTGSGGENGNDSIPQNMVNTTTTMVNDNNQSDGNPASSNRPGATARPNRTAIDLSAELSPENQALKDKLSSLSGAEFDREYLKAAKNNHQGLTRLLETELSSGGDEQAKQWADKYLSLIRQYQLPVVKAGNSKSEAGKW